MPHSIDVARSAPQGRSATLVPVRRFPLSWRHKDEDEETRHEHRQPRHHARRGADALGDHADRGRVPALGAGADRHQRAPRVAEAVDLKAGTRVQGAGLDGVWESEQVGPS